MVSDVSIAGTVHGAMLISLRMRNLWFAQAIGCNQTAPTIIFPGYSGLGV